MPLRTSEQVAQRVETLREKVKGLGDAPDAEEARKLKKALRRAQRKRRNRATHEARVAPKAAEPAAE